MADDLISADSVAPNLTLTCKQMTSYVNKHGDDLIIPNIMAPNITLNSDM